MTDQPETPKRRALTYTEMMNSGTQQPAGAPTEAMEQTKTEPPASSSANSTDQNDKAC